MKYVDRAEAVIKETESTLRQCLSEAAKEGDYNAALKLAGWARTLSGLIKPQPAEETKVGLRSVHPASVNASKKRAERGSAAVGYPKFYRERDRLVRVAWSKKERQEYEHKASHALLDALSKLVADRGADGRVFSSEEILPVIDPDGSEYPAYQVYVGIAFLKSFGLLDQHGRQGYSIPNTKDFLKSIHAVWERLPRS